jgi:hypothetical protein
MSYLRNWPSFDVHVILQHVGEQGLARVEASLACVVEEDHTHGQDESSADQANKYRILRGCI